jgi:hypothetical protein
VADVRCHQSVQAPKVSIKCQEFRAESATSCEPAPRQHHLELSSSILPPATYSINTNMVQQEEQPYRPKDALGAAIKSGMITTGAGLFVSTIQNTLTKQNYGSMGAFTKFGGTTAVYGTSTFWTFALD